MQIKGKEAEARGEGEGETFDVPDSVNVIPSTYQSFSPHMYVIITHTIGCLARDLSQLVTHRK